MPAPTQAPWATTVTLAAIAVDDPPWRPGQPDQVGRHEVGRGAELVQVAAAAEGRTRAGQSHDSTVSSASATSTASSSASRSRALNALRRAGSFSTIDSRPPSRADPHRFGGRLPAPRRARAQPSQRANSGPPSSSEYAAASAARPPATSSTAVCRSNCPHAIAARGDRSIAARSRPSASAQVREPRECRRPERARVPRRRPPGSPSVSVAAAISACRPGLGGP